MLNVLFLAGTVSLFFYLSFVVSSLLITGFILFKEYDRIKHSVMPLHAHICYLFDEIITERNNIPFYNFQDLRKY